MNANIGTADRTVRIVVGAGLIVAALAGAISPWGYLGLVPLATGLVGFCPAYRLFGLSSCGRIR